MPLHNLNGVSGLYQYNNEHIFSVCGRKACIIGVACFVGQTDAYKIKMCVETTRMSRIIRASRIMSLSHKDCLSMHRFYASRV